ncbi:TPA: hypothetical protein RQN23_003870 [Aeromonas veronii]|nr:hypothetical protein [Aeromonas veronii]
MNIAEKARMTLVELNQVHQNAKSHLAKELVTRLKSLCGQYRLQLTYDQFWGVNIDRQAMLSANIPEEELNEIQSIVDVLESADLSKPSKEVINQLC